MICLAIMSDLFVNIHRLLCYFPGTIVALHELQRSLKFIISITDVTPQK